MARPCEVRRIKDAVRQRDGNRCTACSVANDEHKARTGKSLEVHRVEQGCEYSLAPGVCVTLCRACHDNIPRRIRTRAEIRREFVPPPPARRPSTPAEKVAANLRAERARLWWTIRHASGKAGISAALLSAFENVKKVPTLDTLVKLANAYGVPLPVLLAEKG